mgnify:CR=1 FL=1
MSTKRCDIAGSDKARQQRTRQLDRQRHPYAVAVARRDVDRRTFGVLQALQRDLAIALLPFDAPAAASAGNVRLPVSLAGAQWQLQVSSTSQPLVALTLARALGWSLALLITCLAAWMMHLHRRRASLAQALSRSQQDFMRAFDLAPQGMAMLNASGYLLEANQALRQLI